MTARNHTAAALALASALLLAASMFPPAQAAEHAHDAAGSAKLTLNAGKKWPTDAPLRQGMNAIRAAVGADLDAIHTGKQTEPRYDALAKKVSGQVAFIVANCKLEKEADEMLHLVIADILAGVDAMQGKDAKATRQSGAVRVVHALGDYGKFFDHQGWRPLKP